VLVGLGLLYVGAVLSLNGLWLLNRIGDKEIGVINVASGLITLCVALSLAFGSGANLETVRAAALILLFTITYFWVAYNRIASVDGRGLGWFSLFTAITVVPVCLQAMAKARTVADLWLALNWGVWAIVWFMFFLLLTAKKPIQRMTGTATLAAGIVTGWIPGFLLLYGRL
jgi:putative amide transporter protein